ncbi:GNAT family N-acetyltransferase [Flavilitoribacter nigricans]|uniref:GNAT family N-acetyltransferase n=1 Tax=Flavilitoribacter nigricans (strain ATCC 23147 / DSM 23189 / NBRC 102662 / NCIMB 1420 / SS-2) TaxID=1122177 RepID=A0A2D0N4S8_FLAN2|nr:GNAT family N-acetyltransferase [Flavilitoribacter nigricans]PHN03505.1 GNAT family N-acetyltransferase [Flavilitoribacter nigricans DSM 23189 = NBRC 102662]
MITYRTATPDDTTAIARLHTQSWQQHYRGMMSDRYLDEDISAERQAEWQKRMAQPNPEQYILLAMDGEEICGFACVYLNHDPEWGALLDNLHVLPNWQRRGIARQLIYRTAAWVREKTPAAKYHLLVLAGNHNAIKFYDSMGGKNVKKLFYDVPYDRKEPVYLYVWDDWDRLLPA